MLTLAEANQAIAAALARAQNMKMEIAVSVCDEGGRLIAFQRMDGVLLEMIWGAIGKAKAAAATSPAAREFPILISARCGVWPVPACRSPVDREDFRSLATPRRWAPSVSAGAQQIEKTNNWHGVCPTAAPW
jgi:hypothetical protein